jgi:8-oxo-dGTP pyrophosphatase MutT (NUDIX family)
VRSNPSENPAQAIVREVREETGLKVKPERIVGVFGGNGFRLEYSNGDQVEYTVGLLECSRRPSVGCFDTEETKGLQYFAPSGAFSSESRLSNFNFFGIQGFNILRADCRMRQFLCCPSETPNRSSSWQVVS